MIPLSYSGIANPQRTINFTERGARSNNPKNSFVQRFENPYYELCREKLASVDNKKEMILQEKLRQQEKSRQPSQGFFTSKQSKNPNLFESLQHKATKLGENWLLSDKQTSFFSKRHLVR